VPPLLLGLPGDNTFSNYTEANRAFWRQTVLPLVARVQKSFQAWLQPGFGAFRLDYNADRLEALAGERASEWERVGKAAFLTLDEQREALGYGPAPKEALFGKRDLALERRYSPDQPRVPAGIFGAGRWTDGGGGDWNGSNDSPDSSSVAPRVRTAQNESRDRYVVKLKDEESYGHTIERHVGKSDDELLARIEKGRHRTTLGPLGSIVDYRPTVGSFDSKESANDFVNRVLEANKELVDAVADGKLPEAKLERIFGYRTGREAYLASGISSPVIRPTFAVRVVIHGDSKAEKGYRVLTAFPINPRSRN